MTRFACTTTILAILAGPALAGDVASNAKHKGQLTGHDGKQWVMEGCAAYPVTAESAPQQSRPAAAPNSWTRTPKKLAQTKAATTTE